MSTYCEYAPGRPPHDRYHEHEYGFPVHDDNRLFERLILEINQAGLSWETVLKKRDGFRRAYSDFEIEVIAGFDDEDRRRLLDDAGIIRNRLKIDAAIENARRICEIRQSHGSFEAWLDHHHPLSKPDWVKLFRKHFKFVGAEIVGEFLMSTGYLPGAHHEKCPVYARVLAARPAWQQRRPEEADSGGPSRAGN